jgi:hypothetical protein
MADFFCDCISEVYVSKLDKVYFVGQLLTTFLALPDPVQPVMPPPSETVPLQEWGSVPATGLPAALPMPAPSRRRCENAPY